LNEVDFNVVETSLQVNFQFDWWTTTWTEFQHINYRQQSIMMILMCWCD